MAGPGYGDEIDGTSILAGGTGRDDEVLGRLHRLFAVVDLAPRVDDVLNRWSIHSGHTVPRTSVERHLLVGQAVDVQYGYRRRAGAGTQQRPRDRCDGREHCRVTG